MSRIQSVYFMSPEWTTKEARAWLKKERLVPIKRVHKVGHQLRYRILEPISNKYTTMMIHTSTGRPVYFVLGID
jgi:hypothetical protein